MTPPQAGRFANSPASSISEEMRCSQWGQWNLKVMIFMVFGWPYSKSSSHILASSVIGIKIRRTAEQKRCQQDHARCNIQVAPRRMCKVKRQQWVEHNGHDAVNGGKRRPKSIAIEPQSIAAGAENNPACKDVKIV